MKMSPNDIGTVTNESGSAKHENEPRRPRYRQKCVRERKICQWDPRSSLSLKTSLGTQNMKMGSGALGTARNESDLRKI
jgi:hypothetical protein